MSLSLADGPFDTQRLTWMLILHMSFVSSGLLFALMDWVACRAANPAKRGGCGCDSSRPCLRAVAY